MCNLAIAIALGMTPLITLLAVMWRRSREDRAISGSPLAHLAARNLRSYVSRHVPTGPDREAALNCIDVLSGEAVRHG